MWPASPTSLKLRRAYYAIELTAFPANWPAIRSLPSRKAWISVVWRRERDSNPRSRFLGITVFKTVALDRSAISPQYIQCSYFFLNCKILCILLNKKRADKNVSPALKEGLFARLIVFKFLPVVLLMLLESMLVCLHSGQRH